MIFLTAPSFIPGWGSGAGSPVPTIGGPLNVNQPQSPPCYILPSGLRLPGATAVHITLWTWPWEHSLEIHCSGHRAASFIAPSASVHQRKLDLMDSRPGNGQLRKEQARVSVRHAMMAFKKIYFIYLAVSGLSCGTWAFVVACEIFSCVVTCTLSCGM